MWVDLINQVHNKKAHTYRYIFLFICIYIIWDTIDGRNVIHRKTDNM